MVNVFNQHLQMDWDRQLNILPRLTDQIKDFKAFQNIWQGRPFADKCTRKLHSDSSNHAWAGLDLKTGRFVREFWREKSALHINVKELEPAIATVKSLAKQGERFWYA